MRETVSFLLQSFANCATRPASAPEALVCVVIKKMGKNKGYISYVQKKKEQGINRPSLVLMVLMPLLLGMVADERASSDEEL